MVLTHTCSRGRLGWESENHWRRQTGLPAISFFRYMLTQKAWFPRVRRSRGKGVFPVTYSFTWFSLLVQVEF